MTPSRPSSGPWRAAGPRGGGRWTRNLKAAFDHASHDHILRQLGTFPARERIAGWLKAGVIEDGRFAPTEEGTPQGGVISPLIFGIALHGMEEAAGAAYRWNPCREAESAVPGTPVLVRYADDLVALCDSREQAEEAKARLETVAGGPGAGLQRGEDPRGPPRRGLRLPGVQRPPLRPEAADQAERRGCEAHPQEAGRRGARPARGERHGGHPRDRPDRAGVVRLLPGRGVHGDVPQAGSLPVAAALQVGALPPQPPVEAPDREKVLRPVPPDPERPVGLRQPGRPAPTCPGSGGRRSSATTW